MTVFILGINNSVGDIFEVAVQLYDHYWKYGWLDIKEHVDFRVKDELIYIPQWLLEK